MELNKAIENLLKAVEELRRAGVKVHFDTIYAYGEQMAGVSFEGLSWGMRDGEKLTLVVKTTESRSSTSELSH